MADTEAELWQRIRAGDGAAWAVLVRRYQPLVFAVATRAGLSMADAADCFQHAWVALYENRHRLTNPSRISAWLVTTTKREALRLRQRAARTTGTDDPRDLVDHSPLPDEELMQLQRQAHLEIAIRELDERCRRLIDLFFFTPEKMTYDEISESLGIAPNSLGASRHRCLRRLREILVRNGFLEERNSEM